MRVEEGLAAVVGEHTRAAVQPLLGVGDHGGRPDDADGDAPQGRACLARQAVGAVESEPGLGVDMFVPPPEGEERFGNYVRIEVRAAFV